MKAHYRTVDSRLTFEVQGENVKELFAQIAAIQEVFDLACGVCGTPSPVFVTRTVEDNQYYELRCRREDCRAKLEFGQHKKGGGLFPKRKDREGNWLGNGGWTIWEGAKGKENDAR